MKCDELKAYNVVATADVNPEVVDSLGCTEWTGYDKNDVDAAIEELKEELYNQKWRVDEWARNANDKDKQIAELKAKLESVQATAYAESVDAGMENRRLKRALWLARAKRAKEKQQLFHFSLGYEQLCIDGFYDPYSGRRELSPKQWIKAFNKVEVKLLKKAEEYK